VVGGGDFAAAVRRRGFDEAAFVHFWTGGGTLLDCVEGKGLPGLDVKPDLTFRTSGAGYRVD